MSSARNLLQNAAVYSASNVLNLAIPFFLLPILTRVLAPAEYGVLAMFNATLGMFGALTGLSVHGAVSVRYIDRGKIAFPSYVDSCLCILLLSTLVTLSVVALFLNPLSKFSAIPPFWLLVAVIISGGNFLIQIRLGIWLMGKKAVAYGVFQVSLSLLNMGLSLALVLLLEQGYVGRLRGQTLATSVFAIIGLLSLVDAGWVKFRPRWEYISEALKFGVPLIPHVIGGLLISLADRFIINQKLGLEAAGIYMVAAQMGMGLALLADAFNKAFVPWLYEQLKADHPDCMRQIVKVTWFYFGIAMTAAAGFAMVAHCILLLVAGAKYVGAAPALAWIALGQGFGGMYLMVTNYLFYKRQTKVLAWVTLLAGGVGITLTWVFVPVLGITAAGLSFAIAMCLRFVLTWALAQRVCPMPWFSRI